MQNYYSYAGYFGALGIIVTSLLLLFFKQYALVESITHFDIFCMVGFALVCMLLAEWFLQKRYRQRYGLPMTHVSLHRKNSYIFKSAFVRFCLLFLPFLFFYAIVQNHHYFIADNAFSPTRAFFDILLYLFSVLGLPYIFFTLKFNGDKKYEIGDYAILTLVGMKSLFLHMQGYMLRQEKPKYKLYRNRRIKKVLLLYWVNFFFLTLMTRFIVQEFQGLESAWIQITNQSFSSLGWYQQYQVWFIFLFHLLFTIDVGIGIIGYTIASRWLLNRTKSVDTTLGGWLIALLCYPPLNTITTQFISYHGLPTYNLVTEELTKAVVLTLLIVLYSIYVWSTVALGFKFSNLTNRGIVDKGPYAFVRHPAYTAKNMAWWVDNTFVLTNLWATIAMALWNLIYVLRALTEERHLRQDIEYKHYCQKVKNKFIPLLI